MTKETIDAIKEKVSEKWDMQNYKAENSVEFFEDVISATHYVLNKRVRPGVMCIAQERNRQIDELGFTYENDKLYADNQLAQAGAVYAMLPMFNEVNYDENNVPKAWPWSDEYFKPTPEDRIKELSKAGALIAAQIDYIINNSK